MDVLDAIRSWRSVRSYRPDPISRALVAEILWDSVRVSTPPSDHEPWSLCVLEGVEELERYGIEALEYARELHSPDEPGWGWTDRAGFKVFWNAPVAVIFCARRGSAHAPFDCCRAAQNFALASHAQGLGTCWVGAPLPWLQTPSVCARFGIPAGFDPTVVMLLGYPAEMPEQKSRPRPEVIWSNDHVMSDGAVGVGNRQ
jgi:nitroreductase